MTRELSQRTDPDEDMLASFLIGLVGGRRAMTPLATVSVAAATGALPNEFVLKFFCRHRHVSWRRKHIPPLPEGFGGSSDG